LTSTLSTAYIRETHKYGSGSIYRSQRYRETCPNGTRRCYRQRLSTGSPYAPHAKANYTARSTPESDNIRAILSRATLMKEELKSICDIFDHAISMLSASITDHARFLSTAVILPDDILSEIFERCLPQFPSSQPLRYLSSISISQVCKTWRRVALGTSRLWTMYHGVLSKNRIPWQLFGRSGNFPIYLSMNFDHFTVALPHVPSPHDLSPSSLHKVKGVDIHGSINLGRITSWLLHFPNLRRLSLIEVQVTYTFISTLMTYIETNLQQLSHLHIRCIGWHGTTGLLQLRVWADLAVLTLERGKEIDPVQLFTNFPNLVECSLLSFTRIKRVQGESESRLTNTKLRSLNLLVNETVTIKDFFEKTTISSLSTLAFNIEWSIKTKTDVDFLDPFINRSRCKLSNLILLSATIFSPVQTESANRVGTRWSIPRVIFHRGPFETTDVYLDSKDRWYS